MRDIKFRAWSNGEMEYSKDASDFTFWKWVAYDSTTEVMQYTGLRDRKGKEIYEGDILCSPHFPANGTWHYLYHEVKWDNDYTGWKAVSIGNPEGESIKVHGNPQLWVYMKNEKESEVIGNIYQNPDLLSSEAEVQVSDTTKPLNERDAGKQTETI